MARPRKRLPIPARAVRGQFARECECEADQKTALVISPLVGKTQAALEPPGTAARAHRKQGLPVSFAFRTARIEPALSPSGRRFGGPSGRPGLGPVYAVPEPIVGACPQYHLLRPQSESVGSHRFLSLPVSANLPPNLELHVGGTLDFPVAGVVGAAITYHDPDFKVKILGPQMWIRLTAIRCGPIDCGDQAGSFELHHDQQPECFFHGLRIRNHAGLARST